MKGGVCMSNKNKELELNDLEGVTGGSVVEHAPEQPAPGCPALIKFDVIDDKTGKVVKTFLVNSKHTTSNKYELSVADTRDKAYRLDAVLNETIEQTLNRDKPKRKIVLEVLDDNFQL